MTDLTESDIEVIKALLNENKSMIYIADKYGYSYEAIRQWKCRFYKNIDLPPRPIVKQKVITGAQGLAIKQLCRDSDMYSLRMMKRALNLDCSVMTIQRFLHENKLNNYKQRVVIMLSNHHKLNRVSYCI